VRKLLVAAATAVAGVTLISGIPATATAAPSSTTAASISWGKCDSTRLQQAGGQCGFVEVPLDYGKPSGTKISLAVSRIKHKVADAKYQGVMLTNPGGPGGSGLTLSTLGSAVPNHVGDAYDWIGFDPRGVGSSKPALSCISDYAGFNRPQYEPTSLALEKVWLAKSKAYAQACTKNGGALLDHMKTTDSARDMDSIRAALGASQINYYGFSYGTYLGQVYATLFPNRVRRAVLDSNVDPRKVWYQANLDQDIAFERNIKIWFGWVAQYDNVFHLGKTERAVEGQWYRTKAQLAKKPAAGKIGQDEWTDIFLQAGYYIYGWVDLGNAFAGWVHKQDAQPLLDLYGDPTVPQADNGFAVYNAVQCTDVQWPKRWSQWRIDNWRTWAQAPFETWGNAWFNAPCLFWSAKAGTPVTITGKNVAPILLLDETLDAATPYEGTLQVRKLFPKSSLIASPGGTTHAASLSGVACVDDQVAAYLATGKLPARKAGTGADATCPYLARPVPTAPTAKAAQKTAGTTAKAASGLAGQVR
jgi:pimeloyl-ACP methyl ester carboxylesterase